jgi:hypothetical protein
MQALKSNNFMAHNNNAGSISEVTRGNGNASAAFIRSSYASVSTNLLESISIMTFELNFKMDNTG